MLPEIPRAYEVVVNDGEGLTARIFELADRRFKGRHVCKGIIDGVLFVEFLNLEEAFNFDMELFAMGYDGELRDSPYGGAHASRVWDSYR